MRAWSSTNLRPSSWTRVMPPHQDAALCEALCSRPVGHLLWNHFWKHPWEGTEKKSSCLGQHGRKETQVVGETEEQRNTSPSPSFVSIHTWISVSAGVYCSLLLSHTLEPWWRWDSGFRHVSSSGLGLKCCTFNTCRMALYPEHRMSPCPEGEIRQPCS